MKYVLKVKIDANRLCFEKEVVKSKHDRISKQSPDDSQFVSRKSARHKQKKF